MRIKTFLIIIFILCKSFLIYAQQILINGIEGNRNLVWSDFTGTPQPDSSYAAYTFWTIYYKYKGVQVKGDSGMLEDLVVSLLFNPISWVKADKETEDLLQHEQGHFDVGRMAMMEVLDTLKNKTFFTGTVKTDVTMLFSDILKKYNTMDRSYDAETKHGLKKSKQKEWNKFFKTNLEH